MPEGVNQYGCEATGDASVKLLLLQSLTFIIFFYSPLLQLHG